MKKLLLFFIVSATFIACKDNQNRKNTGVIQQNLKGQVQTLTEITINLDSTGNAKSDSTFKISEFNSDGYNTTVTLKDSSGKIIQIQTLVLNADGTVKEMKKSKDGKQIYRFTAEVDKSGNYILCSLYRNRIIFKKLQKENVRIQKISIDEYGNISLSIKNISIPKPSINLDLENVKNKLMDELCRW